MVIELAEGVGDLLDQIGVGKPAGEDGPAWLVDNEAGSAYTLAKNSLP